MYYFKAMGIFALFYFVLFYLVTSKYILYLEKEISLSFGEICIITATKGIAKKASIKNNKNQCVKQKLNY